MTAHPFGLAFLAIMLSFSRIIWLIAWFLGQ
jgi:hypothetical protein